MEKVNTIIKGTYGKQRNYTILDSLPAVNDAPNINFGYDEGSYISNIIPCNDDIAETTSGYPVEDYDFYILEVMQPDSWENGKFERFIDYIAIEKE